MGKFVTRLIVVCNVDGAKSAKSSQPIGPILEPVYTWVQSSHIGVLKGNSRRVTCVQYLFVWCGKRIAQQLPIMGTRLRSVSVVYTGRPATSAYSKEILGKLLARCVSVWNASARRSRIILKGTWLTAQTVIRELSGLFIGIRAPRGYPDCLKTVPAVSVSNSYQRIFGYSNYPPRLSWHGYRQNSKKTECVLRRLKIKLRV